eukprot:CAMPEP_0113301108 /NCGR_PEP_ID=MMETSP0010_2-20120614/2475_1 /TAXON_ID=216773 ORGANISM="Corethron hystrix, Strain 308" /NCGR_SAMPLE_ID=MMETSP0010_2 /ASSEMBLY_ACC=CAM_ASM_000155 /LENGTH=626 /DNA_ID=CAMNT_0000154677 /DNA_START=90 /DNA_END=1967 /DNA_ORIENTATION=+ /assembly_acc=CAM_ASM_000155
MKRISSYNRRPSNAGAYLQQYVDFSDTLARKNSAMDISNNAGHGGTKTSLQPPSLNKNNSSHFIALTRPNTGKTSTALHTAAEAEANTENNIVARVSYDQDAPCWSDIGCKVAAIASDFCSIVDFVAWMLEKRILDVAPECRLAGGNSSAGELPSEVFAELRRYVAVIGGMYRDVPYHNVEHALQVTTSADTIISMMCPKGSAKYDGHDRTYGIAHDPVARLAVVFAAWIHDADHIGLTNRYLVSKGHELAILYNDKSVAEQNSLTIAFVVLRRPEYARLLKFMCPLEGDYSYFRQVVIDLVMATDISSAERQQISKSKWKEAFPGPDWRTETEKTPQHNPFPKVNRPKISEQSFRHEQPSMPPPHQFPSQLQPLKPSAACIENDLAQRHTTASNIENDLAQRKKYARILEDSSPSLSDENSIKSRATTDILNDEDDFGTVCMNDGEEGAKNSDAIATNNLTSRSKSASLPNCSFFLRRRGSEFRLGIKRALTLSGNTIESYGGNTANNKCSDTEKINTTESHSVACKKLQISAILDLVMGAADISANLQDWPTYVKWFQRLYHENLKAYENNQGEDPSVNLFGGQIIFMDSYSIPLARRLRQCGAFDEATGQTFVNLVMENRKGW